MRINEVLTPKHTYYQDRMNESVVKPYLNYLSSLGTYLKEDAMSKDQLTNIVQQAQQDPQHVVLPQEVKQNFDNELANIPPGPVPNFGPQAQAELNKIPDPQVKQSLLQRAKAAMKDPDSQQTVLAAISSIAGMVAGAATMGLAKDAAKSATNIIGNGLLGVLNARLAGQDWKSALSHGAAHTAAHVAGDALHVDPRDIKQAAGMQDFNKPKKKDKGGDVDIGAGDIADKWKEFVNYGQQLVKQMSQQQPAPAE